MRVAFLGFTERLNRGPVAQGDHVHPARFVLEEACRAVAEARARADLVVVSVHWSFDFAEGPFRGQRRSAHALVEHGADLVLGHGPHILQEVERLESPRGDAVIAYSLGNLVSNQGLRYFIGRRRLPDTLHPAVILPTTRDGVWLRTGFALEEGRLRVTSLEAIPLWTENNFLRWAQREAEALDIHVGPLRAFDAAAQRERQPIIRGALGDAVQLRP